MENENRLRQVAGLQIDGKIRQRVVQFLSMFGIDVGVQSLQIREVVQFIQNMPGYTGQNFPDQYQSEWQGNPKVFNQTRYIQSKDGYQYTY